MSVNSILLVVPTRARPANAARLIGTWHATTEGRSDLLFLVDNDDPARWEYLKACEGTGATVEVGIPGRLVELTNRAALDRLNRYDVFGSLGDDHRFESRWETPILDTVDQLSGVAIVSGDDGIHHDAIPTACFVTSNIVAELGWMALPTLEHLCPDLAWKALAVAADCWRYLPDVRIAHWHPIRGNGVPWDDTYARGNNGDVSARDHAAYEAWLADGIEVDAAKVKVLRAASPAR